MTVETLRPETIDAVIDSMHAAEEVTAPDGTLFRLTDFAVSPVHGAVIAGAARAVAPRATVEVGCASGLSTLYLCRGRLEAGSLDPGSAHTIDLKQTTHWHGLGRRTIESAGLGDVVRFHEEAAHEALPRLAADTRIQLAFLDGWHMLDFVMLEAFYCDLMLDVGGVIALHDMNMPALRHFAAFWCTNRSYEPVRLEEGRLVDRPFETPTREARATAGQAGQYAMHLAPFVEGKTLLLRKTGEDDRRWDFFREWT